MTADPREILVRPSPPPDRTLRYGPDPEQVVDLRGASGPPVVVLHGGFWRPEYDRSHVGPLSADLAGRGLRVATVEYRRPGGPGGDWPGTFDDVVAAMAAVRREYGAERPVIVGHSAGGHLALWYASHFPDQVGAVLALAPVADLDRAYRLDLDGGAVAALLGGGPDDVPDRYAWADPVRLPPPAVAVTVVHGDQDQQVPLSISRSYIDSVHATGGRAELVVLPGAEHFGLIDPHSAAWPTVLAALGRFGD